MKRTLLFLLVLLAAAALPCHAQYEDKTYIGKGEAPIPLLAANVTLERAVIGITESTDCGFYFFQDAKGFHQQKMPVPCFEVQCRYVLKNHGEKTEFLLGLPVDLEKMVPYDVKMFADGKELSGRVLPSSCATMDCPQIIYENTKAYFSSDYYADIVFPVPMGKNQGVMTRAVYYLYSALDDFGGRSLDFYFRPGAGWKGPMQDVQIVVSLLERPGKFSASPSGYAFFDEPDNRFEWEFKNFTPKSDTRISLSIKESIYPPARPSGPEDIKSLAYFFHSGGTRQALGSLSLTELKGLRMELLARHGKVFSDKNAQKNFENQAWYRPNPGYSDRLLTPWDKDLLAQILTFEKKLHHKIKYNR